MEPTPGSPAYYEKLMRESPPLELPNRGTPIYGPPPPEALESNANRKFRESIEKTFLQLNLPQYTGLRNSFKKKYGVNWSTVRNKKISNFKANQATKAARRREALIRHRNAEWAAYVQRLRNTRPAPGPGQPSQGDPVRVVFGYGGKTQKRRSSKKKYAVVQSRKRKQSL